MGRKGVDGLSRAPGRTQRPRSTLRIGLTILLPGKLARYLLFLRLEISLDGSDVGVFGGGEFFPPPKLRRPRQNGRERAEQRCDERENGLPVHSSLPRGNYPAFPCRAPIPA